MSDISPDTKELLDELEAFAKKCEAKNLTAVISVFDVKTSRAYVISKGYLIEAVMAVAAAKEHVAGIIGAKEKNDLRVKAFSTN